MDCSAGKRQAHNSNEHNNANNDNNGNNNAYRHVTRSSADTSVSHQAKRTRTSSALSTADTTASSSSSSSFSSSSSSSAAAAATAALAIELTSLVTIPLAELTALQQQLTAGERTLAAQSAAASHQLTCVQQHLNERIDSLSQQRADALQKVIATHEHFSQLLNERADRITALTAERSDLVQQRDSFSATCDTLRADLQREGEERESERELARAHQLANQHQLEAVQQQCDVRLLHAHTTYDLLQRGYEFETRWRPQLEREHAHRPLALATVAIVSRDPLSRFSLLPRLGPLQLISRYLHAPRLFVVGGSTVGARFSTTLLSLSLGRSSGWTTTPVAAPCFAAATHFQQQLHWCGGRASDATISAQAFALRERSSPFRVDTLSMLAAGRGGHALHAYRDVLLTAGGFAADNKALASVECLRAGAGSWTTVSAMPQAKGACASCMLDASLHVAGGQATSSEGVLADHHRFDLHAAQWFACAQPAGAQPHTWAASAAVLNCFVITGGSLDLAPQPFVSLYDPRSDTWNTRSSLAIARRAHACAVLDSRLWALGGQPTSSNSDFTDTIEEYDFAADRWRIATFALPHRLGCFAAAIVE